MKKIMLSANTDPKSPVTEAYRMVRTSLRLAQKAQEGKELKTILVTSATANEGKSTVIGNLAVVMGRAGRRVLLVDCDFRNPTQHKIFDLANEQGLANCIAAGQAVHAVVQDSGIENVSVLVAGPVAPNPSELLESDKMQAILSELRDMYDYILIDTPPIMPVTDAAVLAGNVDGVIMIVESGRLSPGIVREAKKRLLQGGANILGGILSKVEVGKHESYAYYYNAGDGKKQKN